MRVTHDLQMNVLFADIDNLIEWTDMSRRNMGRLVLETTAACILQYMDMQAGPDGLPWEKLSKGYQEWKDYVAPGAPMAVLRGHMKQLHQLIGLQTITPELARMEFGVDIKAKMEGDKFQWGGLITGTNQPPREFYAINSLAESWANKIFDAAFAAVT